MVALAAESGIPLIPWGGGTAATVGTPAATTGIVLGLGRLDRFVEHEPGDLTATVQAGMTFARFQAALRERGQWLSLDPPDADRATVGGVVAANASGPRRHLYGTARDQLIGVTVVTADGALVRGGGKVVKNVAGYDLPKLFVGSFGTLGIIVELTVRLRPVPEAERWVCVRFDRLKDAGAAVRAIMGSDLIPTAVELLDGDASRAFTADGDAHARGGLRRSRRAGGLAVRGAGFRHEPARRTSCPPAPRRCSGRRLRRAGLDGRGRRRRSLQRAAHPRDRADGARCGRRQAARTQDGLDVARGRGGRHRGAGVSAAIGPI